MDLSDTYFKLEDGDNTIIRLALAPVPNATSYDISIVQGATVMARFTMRATDLTEAWPAPGSEPPGHAAMPRIKYSYPGGFLHGAFTLKVVAKAAGYADSSVGSATFENFGELPYGMFSYSPFAFRVDLSDMVTTPTSSTVKLQFVPEGSAPPTSFGATLSYNAADRRHYYLSSTPMLTPGISYVCYLQITGGGPTRILRSEPLDFGGDSTDTAIELDVGGASVEAETPTQIKCSIRTDVTDTSYGYNPFLPLYLASSAGISFDNLSGFVETSTNRFPFNSGITYELTPVNQYIFYARAPGALDGSEVTIQINFTIGGFWHYMTTTAR